MTWPTQAECDAYYGNPRNRNDATKPSPAWEAANLVRVRAPFTIRYEGHAVPAGVLVHKLCADSLSRIFAEIWESSGNRQEIVDLWGASNYGGAYNYRLMRRGSRLSMHSYGCAIDLDPDRNEMGDATPNFAAVPEVVAAFEREGWVWGGRWGGTSRDGMHFQAARVR